MSIAWRNAMSVGEPTIDADHKHLIGLINGFAAATAENIDHKEISRVLLALAEYAGEHFAREEEFQLSIRYPYHDSHRHSHRDALKRLAAIVEDYTLAPEGPGRDAMIHALTRFLREWVVEHIISSDLRMKPYVVQMRRRQTEAERKKRDAVTIAERMAEMSEAMRRAAE